MKRTRQGLLSAAMHGARALVILLLTVATITLGSALPALGAEPWPEASSDRKTMLVEGPNWGIVAAWEPTVDAIAWQLTVTAPTTAATFDVAVGKAPSRLAGVTDIQVDGEDVPREALPMEDFAEATAAPLGSVIESADAWRLTWDLTPTTTPVEDDSDQPGIVIEFATPILPNDLSDPAYVLTLWPSLRDAAGLELLPAPALDEEADPSGRRAYTLTATWPEEVSAEPAVQPAEAEIEAEDEIEAEPEEEPEAEIAPLAAAPIGVAPLSITLPDRNGFDPTAFRFTTSVDGNPYTSTRALTSTTNAWDRLDVQRVSMREDDRAIDIATFNAWTSLASANVGTTFNAANATAPTFGANEYIHLYQKSPAAAPNSVASATTHADGNLRYRNPPDDFIRTPESNRYGYLFEFNCQVASAANATCANWANDLSLYVQYGLAGKYYTAANPEGLPMGALVTYSHFTFGANNGANGTRWGLSTNHPGLNVSNSLMRGFWMDGIRDLQVQLQFFSLDEAGNFDKLLNIRPTNSPDPRTKSWMTVGPLVNHTVTQTGANYYLGAEAIAKLTDQNNYDLSTSPSIGTSIVKIPSGSGNTQVESYAGMYTSNTSEYNNKLGMVDFERQAISFQIVGTKNVFKFKGGNNNFGKYFSSSFVRPYAPKQPVKKVTGDTQVGGNELDANDPANPATTRLNEVTQVYDDATARSLVPTTTSHTSGTVTYPNGVAIRYVETYTGGTRPAVTMRWDIQLTAGGAWIQDFPAQAGTAYDAFKANIKAYTLNVGGQTGTIATTQYLDDAAKRIAADGQSVTYAGATAGDTVVTMVAGQLMITTPGATPVPLGATQGPAAYRGFVSEVAYYQATKNGTGSNAPYNQGQTARTFYYDIDQETYHIPNDSVSKPETVIMEDTLPVGVRPAATLTFTGASNTATIAGATAVSATGWTVWQNGAVLTAATQNATVTRAQVTTVMGTTDYQYTVSMTLTTAQINAIAFDSSTFTVRLPVRVDTDNAAVKAITDTNPYPSFVMLNQARSYWASVDTVDQTNSFSWDGRTNTVRTQISFDSSFASMTYVALGIQPVWEDPTSATGSQLDVPGIAEMRQKALENQPNYLEYLLYQSIDGGAEVPTGQVYRVEKPDAGTFAWPQVSVVGLPGQTTEGLPIAYSVREIEPSHVDEVESLREQSVPEAGDVATLFTFVNRPIVSVHGRKTWIERPDSTPPTHGGLTIYLTRQGARLTGTSVTANDTTSWEYEFSGLARYGHVDAEGNVTSALDQAWVELNYGVTEAPQTYYTKLDDVRPVPYATGDVTHNLTNTYKTVVDFTPIEGLKNWADEDNIEGKRPAELFLRLSRARLDGAPEVVATYRTDAEGGDGPGGLEPWHYDFGSLVASTNTLNPQVVAEDTAAWEQIDPELQRPLTETYTGLERRLFAKNYFTQAGGRVENYTYTLEEFTLDADGEEQDHVSGYSRGQTTLNLKPYLTADGVYTTSESNSAEFSYSFALTNRLTVTSTLTNKKAVELHVMSAEDSSGVPEAIFELYQYSASTHTWVYMDQAASDTAGDLAFTGLGAGSNDPTITGTTEADRVARDNGIRYRLRQISAPIGYQLPTYEIEFELVHNLAVAAATVSGRAYPAIAAKTYTVVKNDSVKLFPASDLSGPAGFAMRHAERLPIGNTAGFLSNTTATNKAEVQGLTAAVELDLDHNAGNSHTIGSGYATGTAQLNGTYNVAGNLNRMVAANAWGEESTYYNTAIQVTAQTAATPLTTAVYTHQLTAVGDSVAAGGRNHIDRSMRLIIKNQRRHMPFPTTGGLGPTILVGAGLVLVGYGLWRQQRREMGMA